MSMQVVAKKRNLVHPFATPNGLHFHDAAAPSLQVDTMKANILRNPAESILVANAGVLANGGAVAVDVHEPLFVQQLDAVYDYYAVNKAKIRVDFFVAEAGATPEAFLVGIALRDKETAFTDLSRYIENEPQACAWQPLSPEGVASLTLEVDVAKFFGVNPNDSTLRSMVVGTPTNSLFFHIWSQPIDNRGGTTNTSRVAYTIYVEYDTTWSEPKDITRSNL